jgi:hypothetical protein
MVLRRYDDKDIACRFASSAYTFDVSELVVWWDEIFESGVFTERSSFLRNSNAIEVYAPHYRFGCS